ADGSCRKTVMLTPQPPSSSSRKFVQTHLYSKLMAQVSLEVCGDKAQITLKVQSTNKEVHKVGSSEDLLTPFKSVQTGLEGETLTLSCNYSVAIYNLFWYRQSSGSSPQLLIAGLSDQTGEKFSLKHKKKEKEFDLQISSAAVTDSAVYY
ncbi:unnamed protein product, partial [Menidia menidia]